MRIFSQDVQMKGSSLCGCPGTKLVIILYDTVEQIIERRYFAIGFSESKPKHPNAFSRLEEHLHNIWK